MSDSGPLGPLTPEKLAALARRLNELEAENERLRERVDELEQRPVVEFRGSDSDPSNIWVGSHPLGKIAYNAKQRSTKDSNRIDALEESVYNSDQQRVNSDGLGQLLPVHRMLLDLSNGREAAIPGAPARRATRLYRAFARRASGRTDDLATLVDATNNTYSLSSTGAREILEDAGDISKGGKSKTVARAMDELESLSRRTDDDELLLRFDDSSGTNYVVANKGAFETELDRVQRVLTGEAAADDPSEQDGEAPARDTENRDLERDAEEELDRLLK